MMRETAREIPREMTEDLKIITIKYRGWRVGKGVMHIILNRFFPASVKNLRDLLKVIQMSIEEESLIDEITQYLRDELERLKNIEKEEVKEFKTKAEQKEAEQEAKRIETAKARLVRNLKQIEEKRRW